MTSTIDLDDLMTKLASHKKSAFVPHTADGDTSQDSSKFSGIAWINEGEEWPLCGYCAKPMQLFLQLNLASVPKRQSYWPASGFLQVFYCTTEDTYCQEAGDDAFSPFGKFLQARLTTKGSSPKVFTSSPVENPLPARVITEWREVADYPAPAELEEMGDEFSEDECMHLFEQATDFDAEEKSINVIVDKLAGYPMWLQHIAYPECPECKKAMDFIFQIGSEKGLQYMFGDCGLAGLFECQEHPEQLAFSWAGG